MNHVTRMKPLLERIDRREVLVADGAMGTMLFERGLEAGECPESINLTDPQVLEEIAGGYLDAGADIIQTNTFGASPLKLALFNRDGDAETINRNAVLAVRRAVDGRAYVCGSCGPSGRMLKPHGETDPEQIHRGFLEQMGWLVDAGVDCVCVETMVDATEATLAVKAAREVSPTIPILATMTFDRTPRGFFTIMGVGIQAAAGLLEEAGANVVGSNCGSGIESMIEIAREFRECSKLPLIIQSNAGLPKTNAGMVTYDETPEFTADKARQLLAAGVSIIGGCCGTTPQHVRAIRRIVDDMVVA